MFIGIDLGTSGVKVVLVDADQRVIASHTAPLTVSRPHSGHSEQDPAHWVAATRSALSDLAAAQDLSGVAAIGLSGQMHGATMLDASDAVLAPCMLWNDTRAHVEAAAMDADPAFRAVTGNIVFPGFTAPKVAWMRTHRRQTFDQIVRVLLPKDYLRLWLTGEAVSEMSDAAGTAWLDVGARDWSDDLLAKTGLDRSQMPRLVEGSAVSGQLRGTLAAEFGLPRDVVVAGGAGDNAASAIGVGTVLPGQGFVSLGTSGVLFAATPGYGPAPASALHTFCHAVPDTWHQMGVILACSDALSWLGRLVGASAQQMTGALGDLQAPGRGLFLPYLGGERTPHNDAQVRGAFIGLDHGTDRDAATRAVLEGTAFAFKDSLDAMRATGTRLDSLVAVGGGAASAYWVASIATALDLPIDIPAEGDFGAAFGAARLGMMAAGAGAADVVAPPRIARQILPDPALTDAFATAHARYTATYTALKDLS